MQVLAYEAPDPLLSLPMVSGTLGGIGLLIGSQNLLGFSLQRHAEGGPVRRQSNRAGLARVPGYRLHGAVARDPSRQRDGAVRDAAPWQVSARGIPTAALIKHTLEKLLPCRIGLGGGRGVA